MKLLEVVEFVLTGRRKNWIGLDGIVDIFKGRK